MVSLRLAAWPGTTTTLPPFASTSAASSVASPPVACAARNADARNAWGVCTATSCDRSSVPPSTVRIVSVTDRLSHWISPPEPPLQSYAEKPAARIAEGLRISRECVETIAAEAAAAGARTMVMLMPARFQVDDTDYGHLKRAVEGAGGKLVRDAATERFDRAIAELPVPRFDALPALRAALPGPDEVVRTAPPGVTVMDVEEVGRPGG